MATAVVFALVSRSALANADACVRVPTVAFLPKWEQSRFATPCDNSNMENIQRTTI